MEVTCRDAFAIYLQTQGGCDERRFVSSICNIIANCRPLRERTYISYGQYRFLYSIITGLFRDRKCSMSSGMKIIHEISRLRIGNYEDEERPIEDIVDAVLLSCT